MGSMHDFLEGKGLDLRDALRPLMPVMATKGEMSSLSERQKREQARYGKNGSMHYFMDKYVRDAETSMMQFINTAIYNGAEISCYGYGPGREAAALSMQGRWESRMRELYREDYDRLRYHKPGDPEVVKRLLDDAAKTGKDKELPECLQAQFAASRFGKRKRR